MCGTTHLGHILKHGDQVIGYDLESLNANIELQNVENQKYLPDFILIRKFYQKRQRIWKLKRMEIEEEELEKKKKKKDIQQEMELEQQDLEEFYDELEQNKNLRQNINLYKNEEVKGDVELDEEMVHLKELVQELTLKEEEKMEELEVDGFVNQLQDLTMTTRKW